MAMLIRLFVCAITAVLSANAWAHTIDVYRHWTGAGGDGRWNNPQNWQEGEVPKDGDTLFFVTHDDKPIVNDIPGLKLWEIRFNGDPACAVTNTITLKGEAFTLTSWYNAWENYSPVDLQAPVTFDPESEHKFNFVINSHLVIDAQVTILGETTATLYSHYGADRWKGGVQLNADLVGEKTAIRSMLNNQSYLGGSPLTANGRIRVKSIEMNPREWTYIYLDFMTTGNTADFLSVSYGDGIRFRKANCFENAPRLVMDYWRFENGCVNYFFETDQTIDRIEDNPDTPVTEAISVTTCGNIYGGSASDDNPHVIMMRGTGNASTAARVMGGISLVWDPVGNYVQSFANRINGTTGDIEVRGGTFQVSGSGTFANVRSISVASGATFDLATTASDALANLKRLVLSGGTFKVGRDAANPFSGNKLESVVLSDGAKFDLTSGASLTLSAPIVDGAYVTAGTYTGSGATGTKVGWIEGSGTVTVVLPAGVSLWKAAVDGDWSVGVNWLDGAVPSATGSARVFVCGGDYTVTAGGEVALPQTLTVGNEGSGTATLRTTGSARKENGTLTIAKGGCVEASGNFELVGDMKTTTALQIERGGTFVAHDATVLFDKTVNDSADKLLNMLGGDFLFTNATVNFRGTSSSQCGYTTIFGSGRTVFAGTTVIMRTDQVPFWYLRTTDSSVDAVMEFLGSAKVDAAEHMFYTGGTGGRTVLRIATDDTSVGTLCHGLFIGRGPGRSEFLLESGSVQLDLYDFAVGTTGEDLSQYVGDTDAYVRICRNGKLTVCCYAGANTSRASSAGYAGGKLAGIIIGDARHQFNSTARKVGKLELEGTLENWYGYLLVGCGPASEGDFTINGGVFTTRYADSSLPASAVENEYAIGSFGGIGRLTMTSGSFKALRKVYIGGATTNDLHRLAYNGDVLVPHHDAKGTVSIAGGTFETEDAIVLGADGTGVLELSGTGLVKASAIVVSNTVDQAESVLRFVADSDKRFGQIDPATRLAFAKGTKLEIDAARFPAAGGSRTLFELDEPVEGRENVTVSILNGTKDSSYVWSVDGRSLRYRDPRGVCIVIR